MLAVLEQVLVVLDLGFNKDASDGSEVDAAANSVPGLLASLSFLSLMIIECFPNAAVILLTEGCFSNTDYLMDLRILVILMFDW